MPWPSDKQSAANNERRLLRRAYIKEVKMESGCVWCGYEACSDALDFHHTGDEKKAKAVSVLVNNNVSWEKLNREIAKCIVLCRNCHAEYHSKQEVGTMNTMKVEV